MKELILPDYIEQYNPNVLNEKDVATMSQEEIWHFNNCGEVLDTVDELLELLKGYGVDYDLDQLRIRVLHLKNKLHLTAIPI